MSRPEVAREPVTARERRAYRRPLSNRAWQAFLKYLARLAAITLFRVRTRGRELVPATGGSLLLSNHQSNLDPLFVGLTCNRRLNYVARATLFRFGPLRWLLRTLDAIPIDREGLGLAGLKETLKRLKRGELVLLFPEGTRTRNGELQPIKPGFCVVARRAGVPIVPVALAGSYEAWPRERRILRITPIYVHYGPPLLPAEFSRLNDAELVAEVERRIGACFEEAQIARQRALRLPQ
jgi:1-acyl-sn-glycerol-3-phosphate acyltransferase